MEKKVSFCIAMLCVTCLLLSIGIFINTNMIVRVNKKVVNSNNDNKGEMVCQRPQEIIAKAEDVADLFRCSNGLTDIEVWTYTDGNTDVVINGE